LVAISAQCSSGISEHIKFTMGVNEENYIPFLDVLIRRDNDGSLSSQVYKKTHKDRYLHVDSQDYPSRKPGVIITLVTCTFRLSDNEHHEREIDHLSKVFKWNGYKDRQIKHIIRKVQRRPWRRQNTDDEMGKITLPYIKGTTDKIVRILRKRRLG